MELVEIETSSSLLLSLLKVILWSIKVYNYFVLRVHFFLRTLRMLASSKWNGNLSTSSVKVLNEKPVLNKEARSLKKQSCEEICKEELITVMDRLGMGCEIEEENWKNVSVNEFAALFDEEPSLAEIKEVFQVFDENKDGYIDAADLQRILYGLCIREEGYELEECRRMLCAFDDNGDGLIGFTEFVTFMEKLQ